MRWLEWIFTDPLAQMTVLSAILTAVLAMLILRKLLTRGRKPALSILIYTSLAWFLFSAPCAYYWREIIARNAPTGPLLHSVPVAEFKATTGQTISLASLHGKVVLLDFWASWCAPCRKSSPAIAELQKTYGADLVTVSVGEDEAEKDWRAALGGARPAYDTYDSGQKLRWTFRVGPLPKFVILDKNGAVDSIETGWEPATMDRLQEAINRNLGRTR